MSASYPIPILIFNVVALLFLFFSREGGLKAIIIASYCGVIVISFTRGSSGGIWLASFFLFIIGISVIKKPKLPAFNSLLVIRFTYLLFIFFIIGIFIGFFRFNPILINIKAGTYKTLFGIPLNYLIAIYRMHIVASLYLAFIIPIHYYVNDELFLKCIKLCWIFYVILAVLALIDYFGIADTAFSFRRVEGFRHVAILGFNRASIGLMLMTGFFMSFTMIKLTKSSILRKLGYISLPIIILSLFTTFSRSAVISFFIGIITLAIMVASIKGMKGIWIALLCILFIYAGVLRFPEINKRFNFLLSGKFDVHSGAAGTRLIGWQDTLNWLIDNPDVFILGVGFQNFHYFVNLEKKATFLEAGHSNFLHILIELGIFGFFIFIFYIISIFIWLIKWVHTISGKSSKLIPSIFIALMFAIIASCLTQESLAPSFPMVPWLIHFFIILGLWISNYRAKIIEILVKMSAIRS